MKKSWFSFNKSYKVYVDDELVGKIEGLYFNIFGERLVLKDLDGDVYGSEQQIKRWNININRLAQVYNGADDTVGFIGEQVIRDMFRYGKTFHFYEVEQNEIAVSRQKIFHILPNYLIEDMENIADSYIAGTEPYNHCQQRNMDNYQQYQREIDNAQNVVGEGHSAG